MKIILSIIAASAAVFILTSASSSLAGEVTSNSDGTTVWQAGVDNVEIEWAPDGSFSRVYSRFSQPVNFPDRQGISKAQIIAEEKAKAAIIRFMDQHVASARVVAVVENDMNQSTRTKGTNQDENIQKMSQRQMVESLSEVTSSAAAGKLRGVIVLERGYDQKEEIAWVKVGISKKTMGAAGGLKDALQGNPTPPAKMNPSAGQMNPSGGQKSNNPMQLPGSEVQRSKQKDF